LNEIKSLNKSLTHHTKLTKLTTQLFVILYLITHTFKHGSFFLILRPNQNRIFF